MPIPSCPSCEIAMEVQHYEDVLFDVCPSCRGVWLDRGEMHKIIAHVRRQEAGAPSADFGDTARTDPDRETRGGADTGRDQRDDEDFRKRRDEQYDDRYEERYRKRRKRGFWDVIEDLID